MSEATVGLVGEISTSKLPRSKEEDFFVDFRLGSTPLVPDRDTFVGLSSRQHTAFREFQRAGPVQFTFGRIKLKILHNRRTIQFDAFYPLGVKDTAELTEGGVPLRQGIGTKIHQQLIEHLAKRYPGYMVKHSANFMSRERETQLRKIGINPWATYLVEEYRDRIREAIGKNETERKGNSGRER